MKWVHIWVRGARVYGLHSFFFFCPSWKCTMHAANFNLAPFSKAQCYVCTTLLHVVSYEAYHFSRKEIAAWYSYNATTYLKKRQVSLAWCVQNFLLLTATNQKHFLRKIGFLSFLSVIIILFWLSRVMTDTNCEQMKKKKENLKRRRRKLIDYQPDLFHKLELKSFCPWVPHREKKESDSMIFYHRRI